MLNSSTPKKSPRRNASPKAVKVQPAETKYGAKRSEAKVPGEEPRLPPYKELDESGTSQLVNIPQKKRSCSSKYLVGGIVIASACIVVAAVLGVLSATGALMPQELGSASLVIFLFI